MSQVDEVFGEEDETFISPRPPEKRRGFRPALFPAAATTPVDDEDSDICYLCTTAFTNKDKVWSLFGKELHDKCFNAVRSYRRIFPTGSARDHCDQRMLNMPDEFRVEVMPFISDGIAGRDKSHRLKIKAQVQQVDTNYNRNERVDDDLVLNKRRFKSFKKQWDNESSAAASSEFEELLAAQDNEHSTQQQAMVSVPDIPRLRSARGRESAARFQDGGDAGSRDRSRGRAQELGSDRHRARGHGVAREGARHHGADRVRAQGARERKASGTTASSAYRLSPSASTRRRVSRDDQSLSSAGLRLTPAALEEHEDRLVACVAESPPTKRRWAAGVLAAPGSASKPKLNPLTYMQVSV